MTTCMAKSLMFGKGQQSLAHDLHVIGIDI